MPRPTIDLGYRVGGNLLFERVVAAIGFDEWLIRRTVKEALDRVGSSPLRVTPHEIGMLLPEIERRLLLLVGHERATPGLARLRRLLLCWEAA